MKPLVSPGNRPASPRVATPVAPASDARLRPRAEGKFLFTADEKFYVKGVTYGPLGPPEGGRAFGHPLEVERDLISMRKNGINTLRTYEAPPLWFLDSASRHGLRVMVGLAWEQHVAFLEGSRTARRIREKVRRDVAGISGHPAVLGYAVGNEVPAPIVRWHGRTRVARFIERLWQTVKEEDPAGLVTYVNYPTTEYLELPFLDLLSFNVYLEREEDLRAYIARLQNRAGDRPLLMAELGLDARAHGERVQAESLQWQIRAAFEGGCAGAMVFSWTDQWYRGGEEVVDWSFGVTTRDRRPKPALSAVRQAFGNVPVRVRGTCPRISVVVCTYNGSATLEECLRHLADLDYPDYEVVVVDDGSSDGSAEVAAGFDVQLICTPNRGLSSARNTGLRAATGEIVAYLDDDAFPDPDWLTHLAAAFRDSSHAAVGGPNIPPSDEGLVARCVARAPGAPIHVLVSDTEAEHLPGCNMAFRADRLRAVGGFDPRFRTAGDDVDVCWRLMDDGETLGFSPGAVVWHRRRDSVRGYWKQQKGYGQAEGMLERKWPEKYNGAGHVSWTGRIYASGGWSLLPRGRQRIYQGTWGTAPFQTVEEGSPGPVATVAAMPEIWLAVLFLVLLAVLGLAWSPLLLAAAVALTLVGGLCARVVKKAWRACRTEAVHGWRSLAESFALTSLLHLLQPLARLVGRIQAGLAPWRRSTDTPRLVWPVRHLSLWSETWRPIEDWMGSLQRRVQEAGLVVRRGGAYDRWDLEARSGPLGSLRILAAVEEHGEGRQLVRLRLRRRWSPWALGVGVVLTGLGVAAALDDAWLVVLVLGGVVAAIVARSVTEHLTALWVVAREARAMEDHGTDEAVHEADERAGESGVERDAVLGFPPTGLRRAARLVDGAIRYDQRGKTSGRRASRRRMETGAGGEGK